MSMQHSQKSLDKKIHMNYDAGVYFAQLPLVVYVTREIT